MSAFIINFQSPFELDDLWDRYERDGLTNIDHILHYEDTLGEWTVPKDAKVGDRVFFMCAVTSKDHMGHVYAEAKRSAPEEVVAFAEKERELYRRYFGCIVAVGIVAGEPFQSGDSGYAHQVWRSKWYARINRVQLLHNPIPIDSFRSFVTVSRTGSITKLDEEQAAALDKLTVLAGLGEPKDGLPH